MVHCIYQGVTGFNFQIKMYLSPLNDIVFILANSANPDDMPHSAVFHLGLHCLLYPFMGFQYTKG